ncbi:metallophosphoesterase [bacterium]|nr:metallophosphoesterase [bacterium]
MAASTAREPDYVIRLMQDAARANLQDPCRRGNLIELPAEGDALLAGDLHGNSANFRRLVKMADLSGRPNRHLVLQELLHSMYQDTPDHSHVLIEEAAVLKNLYPRQVHIILANHDQAELYGLDIMKRGRSVLRAFAEGLEEAYAFNKDVIREAYAKFLRTLPWAAATPHGIFMSHSMPNRQYVDLFSRELFTQGSPDDDTGKESPAYRLTWGRDLEASTARKFLDRVGADLLVTGHHPVRNGYVTPSPHHIILDCKDAHGACALIPLDRELALEDVVERIHHLNF